MFGIKKTAMERSGKIPPLLERRKSIKKFSKIKVMKTKTRWRVTREVILDGKIQEGFFEEVTFEIRMSQVHEELRKEDVLGEKKSRKGLFCSKIQKGRFDLHSYVWRRMA